MLTPDGKTSENVTLTSREQEILAAAFRALKNSAEIDYDKLAEYGSFKNAGSARACFQPVRRKLDLLSGGTGVLGKVRKSPAKSSPSKTPKKGKKAKSEPVTDEEDEVNTGSKRKADSPLVDEDGEEPAKSKVKTEEDTE